MKSWLLGLEPPTCKSAPGTNFARIGWKRHSEASFPSHLGRLSDCFEAWGLGFEVWGLGLEVRGLGFEVWGLVFEDWGQGIELWGLGFEVWRLGFEVLGLGFEVSGLGFDVCGLGFEDWTLMVGWASGPSP